MKLRYLWYSIKVLTVLLSCCFDFQFSPRLLHVVLLCRNQVFEKPVDRETRDDFNAASSKEPKSWREVRAERIRDEMEKGR